jgi:hypothetical protein
MLLTVPVESSGRCCDRWHSGSTFSPAGSKISPLEESLGLGVEAAMESLSVPEANK